jgi:hypothetical protein
MDRKFTVLLSQDDDNKLNAVCDQTQESKGAAIRRFIRAAYAMQCAGQPVCASGMRCFVPHMHQAQTFMNTEATTPPERKPAA